MPAFVCQSKLLVFDRDTQFFISKTFISNARLKLAQNQANAKQDPEAKLLLFENYLHSSYPHYHPKMIKYILKNKQVCLYSYDYSK